jgi:hypothetical protein
VCRYPLLRLRARGSRVVAAKIATQKTRSNISKPEQHNIFGAEGPHRDREQQRRVDTSREGHSQPPDRSETAETAATAPTLQCSLRLSGMISENVAVDSPFNGPV